MTENGHQSLIGTTLAERYVIRELVGTGSFGSVYRAEHLALGTRVAIKLLHAELASPDVRTRFEREARTAAQLRHPNSVSIMDFGEEGGRPFIVMEFLDGYSLADVLAENATLSLDRIVAIMGQVCAGLAAAHAIGVTHRDIKPENIVLVEVPGSKGRREHAKLCDFGIAHTELATKRKDGRPLTMAGQVVGTPAFMAPEQALGDAVDARADIYACGVVLYLLATGTIPFDFASPMEVLQAHVDRSPPLPSTRSTDIPRGFEALVLRCLEKRPADRFASAVELRNALLGLLDDPSARGWSSPSEIHSGDLPTLARPVTARDEFGDLFDTGSVEGASAPSRDAEVADELADIGLTTLEQELDDDPFYEVGLTTEERLGIDFDNELELDDDDEDVDELRAALRSVAHARAVDRKNRQARGGSSATSNPDDALDRLHDAPDPFRRARHHRGHGRVSAFHIDATRNRVPSADQPAVEPEKPAAKTKRTLLFVGAGIAAIAIAIAATVSIAF